jgi:eukaryotic-like serine/threonine-protein kinase
MYHCRASAPRFHSEIRLMSSQPLDEEAIFQGARAIDNGEARRRFVAEACAGDDALRNRVDALLAEQDQLGSFLDVSPAAVATIERPVCERLGKQIGPYKLLQELGQGGMGAVFLAEQQQPVKRQVALKIIKAGMDSAQVIARFEQERQALAIMDHPNIAKVLDAGTTDSGRPYFVMELVKGIPITRYCDQDHLSPKERLELFIPVCHAVQHAHQKGIIHRDLKPSNVLIALYDGRPIPKVIDFGVVKATSQKLTERTLFTEVGSIVGTLEYMAPEQAELNNLDIDTRADIYSLGVLLYELLTGAPPFSGQQLRAAGFGEMLRIIKEVEPQKPSTKLSSSAELPSIAANRQLEPARLTRLVRGDLDWIVMKCLEKERARRYETANALAADILRYLDDEPVQACPPTMSYRLHKFVRRNKGPAVTGILVLLTLIGGVVGTTWQMILARDARAHILREAAEKEAALDSAQQSERGAKDQLFLALLSQARAGRFSRQMGQRLDSLAALSKASGIRSDDQLRDEAIAAMTLPDIRRVPVASSAPAGTTAIGFDSQYRFYARANTAGFISIRNTSDDREIQRIASGSILGIGLYFSPDDQFLFAVGQGSKLGLWRVADGHQVIQEDLRDCWANAFSPDGRRLAVGQYERVICFELPTGQELNRWTVSAPVDSLAFHPDSSQLAVGYSRSNVVSIYDSQAGSLLTDLPVGAMQHQFVAWHPDGKRLAVSSSDPRIQIWDMGARRKVATLEGHVQRVHTLTFHPDGSLLASHSWGASLRLWDTATGRSLLQLPVALSGRPRFSRDGKWVAGALAGARPELFEVTPNHEYRTLFSSGPIPTGASVPADISPDGRLLAVGNSDGMERGTRLWELHSGRELAALPTGTNYVCFEGGPRPALLTCGLDGLRRWPVISDDSTLAKHLHLGPPRQLSTLRRAWFARTADGHTLAAVTEVGGANNILDLETGRIRQTLAKHPNGEIHALSRDGRWAASCGWHSQTVRLWNAETGQMVHEWDLAAHAFVFFTPDSETLIISRPDEFSFWDVQTFQPVRRLARAIAQHPGHVAFSPDGKLMALEMEPATIHLLEVATGRTVARLEDPHGDRATWQGFTPDGTELVVVSTYGSAIHIWNLRAIRARLKEMSLDWEWPEFAPVPDRQRDSYEPLTMEVDLGDLAKPQLTRKQKAQQAIERYRLNPEVRPQSAKACNELAWSLLTATEAYRDSEQAVPLAEKALRLEPENTLYRNTLGVAYYRAGRYREAVEILEINLAKQKDWALSFDLYFLAMGYHRLGETVRARDYFDWAVRWTKAQNDLPAGQTEELTAFQAEAEEVLDVKKVDGAVKRQ